MSSETPFRLALLGVFIPTVLIAFYHRLQAASSGERVSRKEEGYVFAAALRLAGLCVFVCTAAYAANSQWIQRASLPLPNWLRWTGAIVGALAIVLVYWTLSSLGKNLTDTVYVRKA